MMSPEMVEQILAECVKGETILFIKPTAPTTLQSETNSFYGVFDELKDGVLSIDLSFHDGDEIPITNIEGVETLDPLEAVAVLNNHC